MCWVIGLGQANVTLDYDIAGVACIEVDGLETVAARIAKQVSCDHDVGTLDVVPGGRVEVHRVGTIGATDGAFEHLDTVFDQDGVTGRDDIGGNLVGESGSDESHFDIVSMRVGLRSCQSPFDEELAANLGRSEGDGILEFVGLDVNFMSSINATDSDAITTWHYLELPVG